MLPVCGNDASARQPRAIGTGAVGVCSDASGKTRLKDLHQSGAMKLVFPQTFRDDAEVILVNTAGGVTGGDQFSLSATSGQNACLTLTTQAAERAYRAQPGQQARITTDLSVTGAARLNWLPQEMILFDHCALQRRLNVNLSAEATFLMVEPLVLGRAAMQEELHDIRFEDRVSISRNAKLIYRDGINLTGTTATQLARPAIGAGSGALASLVYIAPSAAYDLAHIRTMLPQTAGASLIGEDMLVMRLLAPDSFVLRKTLIPVLEHLTRNALPTSWRL